MQPGAGGAPFHYYRKRAEELGVIGEDGKLDRAALAEIKKPSLRARLEQAARELEQMTALEQTAA